MDHPAPIEDFHFSPLLGTNPTEFGNGRARHERRDFLGHGMLRPRITLPDGAPGLHSSPCPDREVTMLVMFPGGPLADLGGPSELTHGHHEGILHHATVVKIVEKSREGTVEDRTVPVLQ